MNNCRNVALVHIVCEIACGWTYLTREVMQSDFSYHGSDLFSFDRNNYFHVNEWDSMHLQKKRELAAGEKIEQLKDVEQCVFDLVWEKKKV